MNQIVFFQGTEKRKLVSNLPQMNLSWILESLLVTTVDKDWGNVSGAIVERFIKPRASKIFGHQSYSLGDPRPLILVSGPHEEFFNSAFGIYIYGDFLVRCCRPIRMHAVWKTLVLSQNRVEQLSSMQHELAMIQSILVPGKHGM